jgi:biotin transport system permease protein
MIGAVHRPGTTPLHRLPAGWKLGALVAFGLAAALAPGLWPFGLAAVALALLLSTGVSPRLLLKDLAWSLGAIAIVALVNGLAQDWHAAALSFARLLALLAAAHAVAVTTPTPDLLAAFERALMPLQRIGLLDASRAALTVSLAIRFVPVLAEEARTIRRAQAARGLGGHPVALAVPLVVRCLRRADALTLALAARGWDGARATPASSDGTRHEP